MWGSWFRGECHNFRVSASFNEKSLGRSAEMPSRLGRGDLTSRRHARATVLTVIHFPLLPLLLPPPLPLPPSFYLLLPPILFIYCFLQLFNLLLLLLLHFLILQLILFLFLLPLFLLFFLLLLLLFLIRFLFSLQLSLSLLHVILFLLIVSQLTCFGLHSGCNHPIRCRKLFVKRERRGRGGKAMFGWKQIKTDLNLKFGDFVSLFLLSWFRSVS